MSHSGFIPHFDPFPFSLLGTCLSFEAILIASFILMRQARLARRADERDHLMLQILLLTEKEITAVVGMDRQIASKLGLTNVAKDKEIEELGLRGDFGTLVCSLISRCHTKQVRFAHNFPFWKPTESMISTISN